jgi:hypothetical protein
MWVLVARKSRHTDGAIVAQRRCWPVADMMPLILAQPYLETTT